MDFELGDGLSSNGTHPDYANVQSSIEAPKSPLPSSDVKDSPDNPSKPCSEEAKAEQDVSLVKKKFKPPMPPTKEAKANVTTEKNDPSINKVCTVSFHPSYPSNSFSHSWSLLELSGRISAPKQDMICLNRTWRRLQKPNLVVRPERRMRLRKHLKQVLIRKLETFHRRLPPFHRKMEPKRLYRLSPATNHLLFHVKKRSRS